MFHPRLRRFQTQKPEVPMADTMPLVNAGSTLDLALSTNEATPSAPAPPRSQHPPAVEPPVPGDMPIAPSRPWYVAQTHIHAESKAAFHLGRQNFDVYLPRYR